MFSPTPMDSQPAFVFLPSVGSWLVSPTTSSRHALLSSQVASSGGVKSARQAKLMDEPPCVAKIDVSACSTPFKLLPSVGTWHLPLPRLRLQEPAPAAPKVEKLKASVAPPPPAAQERPAPPAPKPAQGPMLPKREAAPREAPSPKERSPEAKVSAPRADSATSAGASPGGSDALETPSPARQAPAAVATHGFAQTQGRSATGPALALAPDFASASQPAGVAQEFKVVVPPPYPGVQYRKSRNLNDRWPRYAQSGIVVTGVLEDNGQWLRIEHNIFIPMKVDNITILQPHTGSPEQKNDAPRDVDLAVRAPTSNRQDKAAAPAPAPAPAPEAAPRSAMQQRVESVWAWCMCNHSSAADTEVVVSSGESAGSRGRRS